MAAAGDPRRSLQARYASRADYEAQVAQAAASLVAAGFLLAADVPGIVRRAGAFYDRIRAHPPDDLSCAYLMDGG